MSCAIALITLGLSLAEDLGPAPFAALIAAEVVLIAGMGALFGMMHAAGTAPAAAGDAARLRRDEETLDALEPLRPEEHGSGQR
ncbi:hypothetical protein [Streptomyces sp. NPDC008001]|uniref:hypothetical protein n=1 Tax=Streptomyces sp. NPDC008001 TaxID=3364804 RepID=UPI0036E8DDD4